MSCAGLFANTAGRFGSSATAAVIAGVGSS